VRIKFGAVNVGD